jgi:hypothetical protein
MATLVEENSLQRAIARALEKEAKEKGLVLDGTYLETTYIMTAQIGPKQITITNKNYDAFVESVKAVQARFPNANYYFLASMVKKEY